MSLIRWATSQVGELLCDQLESKVSQSTCQALQI